MLGLHAVLLHKAPGKSFFCHKTCSDGVFVNKGELFLCVKLVFNQHFPLMLLYLVCSHCLTRLLLNLCEQEYVGAGPSTIQ